MIQLEHLNKTYVSDRAEVEALSDITLTINDGEIFGIIGLSGAGKSTLVRCINFLEKPTGGRVIFDGKDMASLSRSELLEARRQMSMIFQGFNLLSQRTVLKNVCFPMEIERGRSRSEITEKAMSLLRTVGLEDKAGSYPSQLSGGQQQRVAIARALATDPKVLLCDEATSALDPTTTQSILSLIKRINKEMGVTVIVITHEMKVIEQICDRVAVLDNGVIAEQGRVRDVFIHPKTEISRNLILPQGEVTEFIPGERCLRLVFDGETLLEPVISTMTLECKCMVNILFANTKIIDSRTYGQMLIQMPEDELAQERIMAFLEDKNIEYREERADGNTETC